MARNVKQATLEMLQRIFRGNRERGHEHDAIFVRGSRPSEFRRVLLAMEQVVDDGKMQLDSLSWREGNVPKLSTECPELTLSELCDRLHDYWRVPIGFGEHKRGVQKHGAFLRFEVVMTNTDRSVLWDRVTVVRTGAETFRACKMRTWDTHGSGFSEF